MTQKNKENIEVLVRSIIEKDEGMIRVKDSSLVSYYVHNSKYMIEVEPEDKTDLRWNSYKSDNYNYDFEGLKKKCLERAKKLRANYIFVSNFYHKDTLLGVITPFMIISENEEEFLLKNFYKDVPEEVSKAASELGITLLDRDYSSYLKNKLDDHYSSRKEFDDCSRFINLVFSLPYKEQNIESNCRILRNNPNHLDWISILAKEYSEGKYFQEYFSELYYKQDKEKVISKIKLLERRPDHDVFLLKKGFVLGETSVMQLYKEDSDAFIGYFEKLGDDARKTVLEKIYEEPFINDKVVAWLEEKHTPLLREVGFLGGKQNGN